MEQKNKRHFVIGTAGHIDHGKTTLVKKLTGTDTDWLKEEKERGMTIDLGFAFLGENITIIDVPGHEKFIRNMVAGVSTIDLVLFVIAADDGVMPQTKEHLEILNLLQIQQGIIVISKIDLVDSDWTELIIDDVKSLVKGSFLEQAPIHKISTESNHGIEELKGVILHNAESATERKDKGVFRLTVDRVFTMKGFGTVVAGTVLSGTMTPDRMIELLPQRLKLRIRGLQIHEHKVDSVKIGDRAAINLIGIEKETIERGNVLAEPDFFRPTRFLDATIYLLKSYTKNLKNTARVRIHIGTSEVLGRISILDKDEIAPGETSYIQIRLEKPVVADINDRFVLRSYSPVMTIGGGRILDVHPKRHKRFSNKIIEKFKQVESGEPQTVVEQFLLEKKYQPVSVSQIAQSLSISTDEIETILHNLINQKLVHILEEKGQRIFIHHQNYDMARTNIIKALQTYHEKFPTKRGINRNDLKVMIQISVDTVLMNDLLNELKNSKEIILFDNKIALSSHTPQISAEQKVWMKQIAINYLSEKMTTSSPQNLATKLNLPVDHVEQTINLLLESNELIKVDDGIIFHRDNIEVAKNLIIHFFDTNQELTVADCRQLWDTSRKYTVPLLNYFDRIGLTVRQHDVRILNPDFNSK